MSEVLLTCILNDAPKFSVYRSDLNIFRQLTVDLLEVHRQQCSSSLRPAALGASPQVI